MKKTVIAVLLALGIVAALGQAGGRFIAQWQNAGTLIGTFTSFMRMNCSTGLTCTYSSGTVTLSASGGGGAFSSLTSGTNTTAAMVVGSGASLAVPTAAVGTNTTQAASTAFVMASGAPVLLETHTASNSATLNFTTCFTNSSYHTFEVKIRNLVPVTNSVQATLRMSTDGGATYDATSGIYDASSFVVNGGGTGNEVGLATTSMQIGWQSVGNTASNGGMGADFDIYDPANGANAKVNVSGNQMFWTPSSSTAAFWAGSYHSTVAVNAFQVLFSSGNITSGVASCYGVTP